MSFEDAFLDMMPHTVTVAPVTSRDKFGTRTYGAAVSYPARVVEEQRRITTLDGVEGMSSHTVWIAPHTSSGIPNLGPESLITLPDGSTPPILRVEVYPDEEGDHHWKIYLGSGGRAA